MLFLVNPEQAQKNGAQDAKPKSVDLATVANILYLDQSGNLHYANDEAKHLLGLSACPSDETASIFELDTCLTQETWPKLIDKLKKHTALNYRSTFKTQDERKIEVECTVEHQVGAALITLYFSDESMRESENQLLRHQNRIYQSFLDTPFLDISIKDLKGRYICTSAGFEKKLRFDRHYAIGKTSEDIYPKEFADYVTNHDEAVISRGSLETQIDMIPNRDKHQTLLIHKFPTFSQQGEICGVGAVSIDISALSNKERAYAETSDRLGDFIDLCDDCFFETDAQWRITSMTGNYQQFFQGLEIFAGNSLAWLLLHHTKNELGMQFYLSSLRKDLKNNITITIVSQEGLEVDAELRIKVITNSNSEIIAYRGMIVAR